MKSWFQFTNELTEEQLLLIIADYKQFQKDGCIGECLLRSAAQVWCDNVGNQGMIVFIMKDLANFAYQYFAEKYFELAHIKV